MPLSQEDAERISSFSGLAVSEFTKPLDETAGILELANDPKTKACVFLETASAELDAEGTCTIYSNRPVGCRCYPVVLDLQDEVFKDELCPWRNEFAPATEEQREMLLALDALIQSQAVERV